jgi:hypothetical protein
MVVLEAAGLNAKELSGYCREPGLYPNKWSAGGELPQCKPEASAHRQKAERCVEVRFEYQREIKRLKKELTQKESTGRSDIDIERCSPSGET